MHSALLVFLVTSLNGNVNHRAGKLLAIIRVILQECCIIHYNEGHSSLSKNPRKYTLCSINEEEIRAKCINC